MSADRIENVGAGSIDLRDKHATVYSPKFTEVVTWLFLLKKDFPKPPILQKDATVGPSTLRDHHWPALHVQWCL